MQLKKHAQLLIYSFLTWLVFYVLGLPDYYQRFPVLIKALLVIGVSALYFPATKYMLRKFWNDGRHIKNALWLALYLTLPLFIYDYLLLGVYKGLGLKFVFPYWYLTFFYFSFWIQFPYVGWKLEQDRKSNDRSKSLQSSS